VAHQASSNMGTGNSVSGVKWFGWEANLSPPLRVGD